MSYIIFEHALPKFGLTGRIQTARLHVVTHFSNEETKTPKI